MLPSYDEMPVAEAEEKVEQPKLYKVLLHNDDYTTMEFVVEILESIFNMPEDQAIQVMLNVHVRGVGVAGIYTFEVAEMKVAKTVAAGRIGIVGAAGRDEETAVERHDGGAVDVAPRRRRPRADGAERIELEDR